MLNPQAAKLSFVAAVFAIILASCGAADETSAGDTSDPTTAPTQSSGDASGEAAGVAPGNGGVVDTRTGSFPCSLSPISSTDSTGAVSGLDALLGDWNALGATAIARDDIVQVLGPDGIPAIDDPQCSPVSEIDFLGDAEAVMVVEIDGEVRGYPAQILTYHELVNDTVGGTPVSVSFCPLCNSAITYDRRVGDQILDFGTTGALHQSSLVMYDRQTETLWTHFDGKGVAGALQGIQLEFFPTQVVSWSDFKEAHPGALVLNRNTGHNRDYGTNPYAGYDQSSDVLSDRFITNDVDPRLPAKERVIGVRADDQGVAIPLDTLLEQRVLTVELAGRSLVVWNLAGTASAIDTGSVATGRDVGATGVFVPEVDGQTLTFTQTGEGFTDAETGSTWNVFGLATAGELAGTQLESVPFLDTFWFAWGTFVDGTEIA